MLTRAQAQAQRQGLRELESASQQRFLPLRRAGQKYGYVRTWGVCGQRPRMTNYILQRFTPCLSGNIADIRLDLHDAEYFMSVEVGQTEGKHGMTTRSAQRQALGNTRLLEKTFDKYVTPQTTDMTDLAQYLVRGRAAGCTRLPVFVEYHFTSGAAGHIFVVVLEFDPEPGVSTKLWWLDTQFHGGTDDAACWYTVTRLLAQAFADAGWLHDEPIEVAQTRLFNETEFPLQMPYDLQEGEESGFCQSWTSFIVYEVVVRGSDPRNLFTWLQGLSQEARQQVVIEFTNWALNKFMADIHSIPVQVPTAFE